MSKKSKIDEAGDSDELQALFDSIAAEPVGRARSPSVARPVEASPLGARADTGDSDELQALFDAVASQAEHTAEPAAPQAAAPAAAASTTQAPVAEQVEPAVVFTRLGQLTRQVHDTLRELGLETTLQEAAEAIPDVRQRLAYIAQMTEQSASRVLNATDVAAPIQSALASGANALVARWDRLYAGELSPGEFRDLSGDTRRFIAEVAAGSRSTSKQLHEIMMAQDFQDLTGQVIKRVLELAQMLESQLVQVLIEATPPQVRAECKASLLNGPVIDGVAGADVLHNQSEVDDLLESLGF